MRLRLLLSFILIALISITTVVLVARQGTANEVRAFMNRAGNIEGISLQDSLENYYQDQGSWEGVEGLLAPHGQGKGRNANGSRPEFILADQDGNILIDTRTAEAGGRLNLGERQLAVRLEVGQQTVGYLVVVGGTENNSEQGSQLIRRLSNAALVAAIIAGVLSLMIAWLLAGRLMRPVNELTSSAEKLGRGDLSERVRVKGEDELSVLGHAFNQMADSLQRAEKSRRAMTADIAHELRNPLAVQRANLEALQDGIYPLTKENLAPVIEQNHLLTRLVEDLRTLALADDGRLELDLVEIDSLELCRRMVESFQPRADELNIGLGLEVPAGYEQNDLAVIGDPIRLEQILGNLLENALRYTPSGGSIVIKNSATDEKVQITIQDNGPGIPEEALPTIFDRFTRGDFARCRNDGGTGLGLAISRQLAEAQNGRLAARNQSGGGAEFTLSMPRAIRL